MSPNATEQSIWAQSQIWWSKATLGYFYAVDCKEAFSQSPFCKGGRGDLKRVQVFDTLDRRKKISPHPSLAKKGVQPIWQTRIDEAHPLA
jgi:hypothetical protein